MREKLLYILIAEIHTWKEKPDLLKQAGVRNPMHWCLPSELSTISSTSGPSGGPQSSQHLCEFRDKRNSDGVQQ